MKRIEPLNGENKLQGDEKNKNWKKHSKTNNIINFNTIRYKLTALNNIFFSIIS